jgi:hypothetical protein
MPPRLKLHDTSPASLYQGEALALFRGLPLRHVDGLFRPQTTTGVPNSWDSRPLEFPMFPCMERSVRYRSPSVPCQAHCLPFSEESFWYPMGADTYFGVAASYAVRRE